MILRGEMLSLISSCDFNTSLWSPTSVARFRQFVFGLLQALPVRLNAAVGYRE